MQPKVCVLMCTYNGEKYLGEQIDSILSQKDVNVILRIRDDGSTDNTLSVLQSYGNRISWHQDQHLNVSKGFIKLAQEAPEADYYAFSDQDDVWLPDKLARAISFLQKAKEDCPAMYACGQIVVNEKLDRLFEHNMNTNRSKDDFFVKNSFSGNTIVFNKRLFELLKLSDLASITGDVYHDRFLTRICIGCGGTLFIDDKNYILYRQHGTNVVGVRKGLREVLFQIKQYLFDVKFEAEFSNLLDYYSNYLETHYLDVCTNAVSNKKHFMKRLKSGKKAQMRFHDKKIGFLYKMKIVFGWY